MTNEEPLLIGRGPARWHERPARLHEDATLRVLLEVVVTVLVGLVGIRAAVVLGTHGGLPFALAPGHFFAGWMLGSFALMVGSYVVTRPARVRRSGAAFQPDWVELRQADLIGLLTGTAVRRRLYWRKLAGYRAGSAEWIELIKATDRRGWQTPVTFDLPVAEGPARATVLERLEHLGLERLS
jgi:hypothetical protein